jgi:F-type H+-transporting ATPase subunit epsilon
MAEPQFHFQIVTPEGVQLDESIDELTAPSVDGQFGVLPGHRPMLATLVTGIISYTQAGVVTQVAVGPGFVEIHQDQAVVLTDKFSNKAAVDPVRVRLELKEADHALDTFEGELGSNEHAALVSRELWAAALLELYGDPPPPTVRGFREPRQIETFQAKPADASDDAAPH